MFRLNDYPKEIKETKKSNLLIKLLIACCIIVSIYYWEDLLKLFSDLFNSDNIEKQYIRKLENNEPLNDSEKQHICNYFLNIGDTSSYNKYCLNVVDDKFQILFERYVQDTTSISREEISYIDTAIKIFKKSCEEASGNLKNGDKLRKECQKTIKGIGKNRDLKHLKQHYLKWFYMFYLYNEIVKEFSLNNIKINYKIYKTDSTFINVNLLNTSLLHIKYRHYLLENFTDSEISLFKNYSYYDELIRDLNDIFKYITLNRVKLDKINFDQESSKLYLFYLIVDTLPMSIYIDKSTNVISSFFIEEKNFYDKLVKIQDSDTLRLNDYIKILIKK